MLLKINFNRRVYNKCGSALKFYAGKNAHLFVIEYGAFFESRRKFISIMKAPILNENLKVHKFFEPIIVYRIKNKMLAESKDSYTILHMKYFKIIVFYIKNKIFASLNRRELFRLYSNYQASDILPTNRWEPPASPPALSNRLPSIVSARLCSDLRYKLAVTETSLQRMKLGLKVS